MAESDAGAAALVDAESTTFTETTAPLSALDSSSTSVPAASEVRAAALEHRRVANAISCVVVGLHATTSAVTRRWLVAVRRESCPYLIICA